MAGINGLVQQAIQEMKQASYKDLYMQSNLYLTKIRNLKTKLTAFDNISTIDKKFIQDYGKGSVAATNIVANDTFQVAYNKIMLDGYHLLSEIGSWVNNSGPVNYSVTVTGMSAQGITKMSWNEMPFADFANLINFASPDSKISMLSSGTIMSKMKNQLKANNKFIETWSPDKLKQYELFKKLARNIGPMVEDKKQTQLIRKMFIDQKQPGKIRSFYQWTKQYKRKWRDVNEGNLLEAFIRFQTYGKNIEPAAVYKAMFDTMKRPDPFYKGGDIGNTQIKGDNASIASHSTILNTLELTESMLSGLTDVLQSNQLNIVEMEIGTNISADIEKQIDKYIQQLIQKYVSGISR